METLLLLLTFQTYQALSWMPLMNHNMYLMKREDKSNNICNTCKKKWDRLPSKLQKLHNRELNNKDYLQKQRDLLQVVYHIGVKDGAETNQTKRFPSLDPIYLYFWKSFFASPAKSLYIECTFFILSISIPFRTSYALFLKALSFFSRWFDFAFFLLCYLNVLPIL